MSGKLSAILARVCARPSSVVYMDATEHATRNAEDARSLGNNFDRSCSTTATIGTFNQTDKLSHCILVSGDAVASSTPVTPVAGSEQIVPETTAGADSSSNSSADSDFPVAAIALVSIVAGIAALFIVYKLYRWHYRRSRVDQSPLPETRLPAMASMGTLGGGSGGFGQHSRSMSAIGLLSAAASSGRQRQESWAGESSLNEKDWSPTPSPGTLSPPPGVLTFDASNNGSNGSLSGMNTAASRASLASSVGPHGAPRRSFYGNNAHVGSGPFLRSMPSSSRLNGAPHSPHSRIAITPPAPLAPPPGTVVAKTKSSLDFAPSSGIDSGALSHLESALASVGDLSKQPLSVPRAAHRNPNKLHTSRTQLSSASSSSTPSPTSSSTGLRNAYHAHAPFPVNTALANASQASFAHENPTSPLDRLQQQIVQQQARMTDDGNSMQTSSAIVADESSIGSSFDAEQMSSDDGYRAPGQILDERISPPRA
ncbi:hypothetical protein ACM66B_004704 [Microbotryomycetes sp. NB124-2]